MQVSSHSVVQTKQCSEKTHVAPAKAKRDRLTDGWTDRRKADKVILMWQLALLLPQK